MLDFTIGMAPYLYEAKRLERDAEAEQRRWNRRLKEIRKADRKRVVKTIIVDRPAHLAGVHKL